MKKIDCSEPQSELSATLDFHQFLIDSIMNAMIDNALLASSLPPFDPRQEKTHVRT